MRTQSIGRASLSLAIAVPFALAASLAGAQSRGTGPGQITLLSVHKNGAFEVRHTTTGTGHVFSGVGGCENVHDRVYQMILDAWARKTAVNLSYVTKGSTMCLDGVQNVL
jgi:hypothetical protein